MNKIETRINAGTEVRVSEKRDDEPRTITGLAVPYDKEAVIAGMFREVFRPGAFDDVLPELDTVYLRNHDRDSLLARTSNGTLKVSDSPEGIRYKATPAADTTVVRDTIADIEAGNLVGNSFAFRIKTEKWTESEDDLPLREVLEADALPDVSVVTDPAYGADTTVALRSLETFQRTTFDDHAGEFAKRERDLYFLER